MKHQTPMAELIRMSESELRRDLQLKHAEAAKLRLGLQMQSEKNSGLYKAHRRDIARMTMVLRGMEKKSKAPMHPAKQKGVVHSDSLPASKISQKASQSVKKPVKRTGSKPKKT